MGLGEGVIMFTMKKYYEVLAIAHPSIELDDTTILPSVQSKLKLTVYEYEPSTPSSVHQALSVSSKLAAEVQQNKLKWEETLYLRFTGQKKIAFEVFHQAQGQQNARKQPIFKGVYYIDKEHISKKDTCHVYSPQGQKQGILRWEIARVKKEEVEVKEEVIYIQKPLIPQNLIGQIRIFEASLEITNPIFNKKKHPNPTLTLAFGDQTWSNQSDQDYSWQFEDIKLQYLPQSSPSIQFSLLQQDTSLLNGSISCDCIRKLKRYVRHPVSLFNKYQIKVGSLWLELRYMDKEELVTFLYSPPNNPDFTKRYRPHPLGGLPLKPSPSGLAIMRRNQSFQSRVKQSKQLPLDRYVMQNSDVFLPKTARFSHGKSNNPYVSYLDPQKLSDFSPKHKKGWDMSRGHKFDFTKQYRGNPGVGTYKLPSIWGAH